MAKKPGSNTPDAPSSTNENAPHLVDDLHKAGPRDPLQEAMISAVGFIENNQKAVMMVVVLAVLAGVGYSAWGMIESRRQKSAQEAFYEVEKRYNEKRAKFEQAKYAKLTAEQDKLSGKDKAADKKSKETPKDMGTPATGDLAKDYGPIVSDLEAFAQAKKGTTAGTQAALLAADTYLQYNQAGKANEVLESAVSATKATTLLGALARMAKGNAQAIAGQCDQALGSWEQVLAAKNLSFLHSEASLRAGLCLEKAGQKDRAIEMYRKASGESEKSEAAQTARSLLRALELGT